MENRHNGNFGGRGNNNRGGVNQSRDRYDNPPYSLPKDYLKDGYFDINKEKNVKKLKREFVLSLAEEISEGISRSRPELTKTQLRRFYDYIKNISDKLRMYDNNYAKVEIDVIKIKEFAADAKTKGKIPQVFYDFISINIATIKGLDDFKKGFLEHFQAIVAYYPKKN